MICYSSKKKNKSLTPELASQPRRIQLYRAETKKMQENRQLKPKHFIFARNKQYIDFLEKKNTLSQSHNLFFSNRYLFNNDSLKFPWSGKYTHTSQAHNYTVWQINWKFKYTTHKHNKLIVFFLLIFRFLLFAFLFLNIICASYLPFSIIIIIVIYLKSLIHVIYILYIFIY